MVVGVENLDMERAPGVGACARPSPRACVPSEGRAASAPRAVTWVATRFPLLTLSTQDGSPLTHTTSGAGVPALYKPSEIFARLFLAGKARDIELELARLKRGQSVLDRMQTRAELYEVLGYHEYEQKLDELFVREGAVK